MTVREAESHRHFEAWGREYDASVLAPWFRHIHARLLAGFAPRSQGLVLDVGCGTGELLRAARAQRPDLRLVGVDFSRAMLDQARRKGIEAVQADVHHLPFRSGAADALTSSISFHHYEDPEAAAREMRRVLAPAGEVWIADGSIPRFFMRAIEQMTHGMPFRGKRTHRDWQVRIALAQAGFRDVASTRLSPGVRLTRGRA